MSGSARNVAKIPVNCDPGDCQRVTPHVPKILSRLHLFFFRPRFLLILALEPGRDAHPFPSIFFPPFNNNLHPFTLFPFLSARRRRNYKQPALEDALVTRARVSCARKHVRAPRESCNYSSSHGRPGILEN